MTTILNDTVTVKAKVGLQEYALRVSRDTEPELHAAVTLVSERFNAILSAGKITNPERIAVMVALNLAVEVNKSTSTAVPGFDFPNTDIASLRKHIGHLLKTP
jgi:cell division protein ZapA (FtsZ GTPase activity inhibitor)